MADQPQSTLQLVAGHLIKALQPLINAGSSLGAFMRLMGRLGFSASDLPPPYQTLASAVGDAVNALENPPASPDFQYINGLLQKAKTVYDSIQQLAAGPLPTGADAEGYAEEIGERLFELLLTDYLTSEFPGARNMLGMLNIITIETIPATPTRPSYVRTHFNWDQFPKIISDPSGLPARVYGWGTPTFNDGLLLQHLGVLGRRLGLNAAYRPTAPGVISGYVNDNDTSISSTERSLVLPFFYANVLGKTIEGALALQRFPQQGTALPGLILEPRLPSAMPLQFSLGPQAVINIRDGTNLGQLFGITLRPPDNIGIVYPFAPGTPPPEVGVGVGFTFTPKTPLLIFGDPAATRLELGGATVNLTADLTGTSVALGFGAALNNLKLTIAAGDGDSFLQSILGNSPASLDLSLEIDWSQENGIRFKGSSAFEVMLHPHVQLGPLTIQDVDISLTASDAAPKVILSAAANISGQLGPFQFSVQGIGIAANLSFQAGNAGPFDISVGFKAPDGLGLQIGSGGFTGGGFLNLDPAKGQYAGGLNLTFQGTISIRAIGILDTNTGTGDGFSLIILVVTEFPPIQLSFGFTLLGVGGLLGLNRAVLLDQLQLGVRDGSLNSVLFPADVVANAGRIISDLQRIFPSQDGLFLIGPMAKIGWGTPTLVSLELGLILDLPSPTFAIVGILKVAAPADQVAIVNLQVSFVGSIDFEKGQFQFDASLFNSKVLNFTLTGDMAVRVYWKDNANLLLSVGGFAPAYTPPPMNLGTLARIGMVLFQGNPDVRAEAYFAVTSNTFQFGARVEIKYGLSVFNVYGFVGLDVLINYHPFHFVAELSAQLAVRTGSDVLFSIQVDLTLDGPTPWHAHGTGSFNIGFIFTVSFSVSFDVTVGTALGTLLAAIDVLAALTAALSNLGNWTPQLPDGSHQSVTVATLPDPTTTLVVHPYGTLAIAQKIVPLNIAIQLFGSSTPAAGSTFKVTPTAVGGSGTTTSATSEEFAPAQFFTMTDADKLSRPSFESYDSGVVVGGDLTPQTDWMRSREVSYEVIYLPEQPSSHRIRFNFPKTFANAALIGSSAAQSSLSQAKTSPSALSEKVVYQPETYAIVSTDDLTLHASELVFGNATAAHQALANLLMVQPELTTLIQVLPVSGLPTAEARL